MAESLPETSSSFPKSIDCWQFRRSQNVLSRNCPDVDRSFQAATANGGVRTKMARIAVFPVLNTHAAHGVWKKTIPGRN
jgi:hypothetical protein